MCLSIFTSHILNCTIFVHFKGRIYIYIRWIFRNIYMPTKEHTVLWNKNLLSNDSRRANIFWSLTFRVPTKITMIPTKPSKLTRAWITMAWLFAIRSSEFDIKKGENISTNSLVMFVFFYIGRATYGTYIIYPRWDIVRYWSRPVST